MTGKHDAVQKSAGGQHHRVGRNFPAVGQNDAGRPAAVKNKPFRRGLQNIKILLFFQRFQHIFAVKLTVGLRPGTADGRTF